MPPLTANSLLQVVAAIATLASVSFYFIATLGMASFLRERQQKLALPRLPDDRLPPVSILKPLKGIDPGIWESLCSHCEQDYPDWQIIFGVSDPADPVIEVVHKLQIKYSTREISLVVCDRVLGTNIKVSNLVQMLPSARHGILLVNDGDIHVLSDYLRKVVAPLEESSVGLVTCLYRGIANPVVGSATFGSRMEALGISTDFAPGVLTAKLLERGLHFGLGSTLAFRRADLAVMGGFEALLDYLADDYELGHRISEAGKHIALSVATVATSLPPYTLREFLRHQLRWSRTIRDARRWGYAGLIFTFGLPWAVVTLIASRGAAWAWVLLAMTLGARMSVGYISAVVVLNDRPFFRHALWLILRDLIAPLTWAASFIGNRIEWRGETFELKRGRLSKVSG